MRDGKIYGPDWRLYQIISFITFLVAFTFFSLFGFSIFGLIGIFFIPSSLLTYFLLRQNKLILQDNCLIEQFLSPWQPTNTIKIENIDWLAVDNRKGNDLLTKFFPSSSVIIKEKNGKLTNLRLTHLKDNQDVQDYFLKLSDQMANHDAELFKLKDLQGVSQLAIDATLGLTDLVESMHHNFTSFPGISPQARQELPSNTSTGITGTVYNSIRAITGLAGSGVDGLLAQVAPLLNKNNSNDTGISKEKQTKVSYERAALLSALNGMLGDYMVNTYNPMSIPMRLRRNGHTLKLNSESLAESIQPITGKLVVLVHGLCMNDLQWYWKDHDHGAELSLDLGYTPVYLRYNTGQHISTNGRAFSELLEVLLKIWPVNVEELVIIGHSMGGLVTRSACYYGEQSEHSWIKKLHKLLFLGSPHHGAPLEQGGNWVDTILESSSYTTPLSRLGKVRSCGITDLRYGNIIDEHWQGRDRFEKSHDIRTPVPLPRNVQCFTIAGTTGSKVGDLRDQLLGDGLVLVNSALGKHKNPSLCLDIPEEQQWLGYGVNHMDLLNNPDVYAKIKQWLT